MRRSLLPEPRLPGDHELFHLLSPEDYARARREIPELARQTVWTITEVTEFVERRMLAGDSLDLALARLRS